MSRRNHILSVLSASYVSLLFSFFAQIYYQSNLSPTFFAKQSIFISTIGLFDSIFLMQFSVLILKKQTKNISPYIFANALILGVESVLIIAYFYFLFPDLLLESVVYITVRVGSSSFSLVNNYLDSEGKYMYVNMGKGLGQLTVIVIMILLISLNIRSDNLLIIREILLVILQLLISVWFFRNSSFSIEIPKLDQTLEIIKEALFIQSARFTEQIFYKSFPLIILYFTSEMFLGEFTQALFYMSVPLLATNPISERYLMVSFAKDDDLYLFLRNFSLAVISISVSFSALVYFYADLVYMYLDKVNWPNISAYMFVLSLTYAPITFFNLLKTYCYINNFQGYVAFAYIIMLIVFALGSLSTDHLPLVYLISWISGLCFLVYNVKITDLFRN